MSKQYLDFDPVSGIAHWVDTDEETGLTYYGADQDITPIIEANKFDQTNDWGRWKDINHVARIPTVTFLSLIQRGILGADGEIYDQEECRKALKKILNDSDYSKLRTRPGVI